MSARTTVASSYTLVTRYCATLTAQPHPGKTLAALNGPVQYNPAVLTIAD